MYWSLSWWRERREEEIIFSWRAYGAEGRGTVRRYWYLIVVRKGRNNKAKASKEHARPKRTQPDEEVEFTLLSNGNNNNYGAALVVATMRNAPSI
jgi:hypothetical protein